MTNPIDRAGNHLHRKIVIEGADSNVFALAKLVFESIDVEDLAVAIAQGYEPDATEANRHDLRAAKAVKAHLLGDTK